MKLLWLRLKFFFSLFTWQASLLLIVISILVFTGSFVVVLPSTVSKPPAEEIKPEEKTIDFARQCKIFIGGETEGLEIFIYDKLSSDKSRPLVAEILSDEEGRKWIELYPGLYKLAFSREGYEPLEQSLVIQSNQREINLNLEFIPFPVPTEIVTDKSDLHIVEIKFFDSESNQYISEIQSGKTVNIRVLIANKGNKIDHFFNLRCKIFENGLWKSIFDYPVSSIAENGTIELRYDWSVPDIHGNYQLKFEMDADKVVDEADEDNNILTADVVIN